MSVRNWFYIVFICAFVSVRLASKIWPPILYLNIILFPVFLLGIYDICQKRCNILRNYPVWGHWRYLLLLIRPQIHQYFVASDQSGRPFNKEQRDLVMHRSQRSLDMLPFGTQKELNEVGQEWISHSMRPTVPSRESLRVMVGNDQCQQPYLASRLNVSAMSFGSLSKNAVLALNRGAKLGSFAHNTGEGGLSAHHLQEGGDLIWQIGTAYFGCRTPSGDFDPNQFQQKAQLPAVKMIEIKLSQGAKPAHGGILPGVKVTAEIADARGIPLGEDCLSPAAHSAFSTPIGLLTFVQQLRELSGGKPVGFKLCLGLRRDFMAICRAMLKTKIYPDFITIDGAEGGTGSAPVEFTDSIGTPLNVALDFVHNCLVGANLRDQVKLIASGKIITGFDMVCKMALGADMVNSARGMLFALGCVQSRRCHNNTCPTGITTQNPKLYYGLAVKAKAEQVKNFHELTLESFREVIGAAGLGFPEALTPGHIHHNIAHSKQQTYAHIHPQLSPGQLLSDKLPAAYQRDWHAASAEQF